MEDVGFLQNRVFRSTGTKRNTNQIYVNDPMEIALNKRMIHLLIPTVLPLLLPGLKCMILLAERYMKKFKRYMKICLIDS